MSVFSLNLRISVTFASLIEAGKVFHSSGAR